MSIEHVLVIPTTVLHQIGHFNGFRAERANDLEQLLDPQQTSYRPRPEMEEDPSFKQLIPYVIFTYRSESGELQVYQYTRGTGQGEKRLHAKRSIGIGGHISTLDAGGANHEVYAAGMRRELDEEVSYQDLVSERRVGLINDDETPVGRVHLGVVHLFELSAPAVQAKEAAMLDAGFRPISQLLSEVDQFETWSQYALRALFS